MNPIVVQDIVNTTTREDLDELLTQHHITGTHTAHMTAGQEGETHRLTLDDGTILEWRQYAADHGDSRVPVAKTPIDRVRFTLEAL